MCAQYGRCSVTFRPKRGQVDESTGGSHKTLSRILRACRASIYDAACRAWPRCTARMPDANGATPQSLANSSLKLLRPGFGPPPTPPRASPASRRHAGRSSLLPSFSLVTAAVAPQRLLRAGQAAQLSERTLGGPKAEGDATCALPITQRGKRKWRPERRSERHFRPQRSLRLADHEVSAWRRRL